MSVTRRANYPHRRLPQQAQDRVRSADEAEQESLQLRLPDCALLVLATPGGALAGANGPRWRSRCSAAPATAWVSGCSRPGGAGVGSARMVADHRRGHPRGVCLPGRGRRIVVSSGAHGLLDDAQLAAVLATSGRTWPDGITSCSPGPSAWPARFRLFHTAETQIATLSGRRRRRAELRSAGSGRGRAHPPRHPTPQPPRSVPAAPPPRCGCAACSPARSDRSRPRRPGIGDCGRPGRRPGPGLRRAPLSPPPDSTTARSPTRP